MPNLNNNAAAWLPAWKALSAFSFSLSNRVFYSHNNDKMQWISVKNRKI